MSINVSACESALAADLRETRDELERMLNISGSETLGMKAWIVPPWYFALRVREWALVGYWVTWLTPVVRHPRMIRIAEVPWSTPGRSGVRWTVGKGLLWDSVNVTTPGRTVAAKNGHDHRRIWTKSMPDFLKLRDNERGNLSRKDYRKVVQVYGIAVAAPIIVALDAPAIGCVTIHTPASASLLTDDELQTCGEYANYAAELCSEVLVKQQHYLKKAGVD